MIITNIILNKENVFEERENYCVAMNLLSKIGQEENKDRMVSQKTHVAQIPLGEEVEKHGQC